MRKGSIFFDKMRCFFLTLDKVKIYRAENAANFVIFTQLAKDKTLMPSNTVENYLKAIYHLSNATQSKVQTNHLASHLEVKSSSVTDMIKKLESYGWVLYEPYRGVELTESGRKEAIHVIRKHRLWEVFLVEKLKFKWSDVHPIAEQLEHVHSTELIDQLDEFLNFPKWDPHGDPIPDKNGVMSQRDQKPLADVAKGKIVTMLGVSEDNKSLLEYLEYLHLKLGLAIKVVDILEFDGTMTIEVNGKLVHISPKAASKVLVSKH